MTSRTRASTRAKASGDDSSSRSDHPFAPSRERRSRESKATAAAAATSSTVASGAMTRPRRLHPYLSRRSPRSACHFDGLAAVEVQAIMQMLDQHSLLKLARCSKRMHADADCDAAWQSQPPLDFRLDRGTGALIVGRFHPSLLTHVAAIRILPKMPNTAGWQPLLEEDIDAMLTLPRITEVDDCHSRHNIPTHEWFRILQHPAMAGLTVLRIGHRAPREIITNLVHLPRLHTLEFQAYAAPLAGAPYALDAAALSSLPSLTALTVHKLISNIYPSILPAIAACTHLTRLRLVEARLQEGEFRRLFTSPHMSRLQRLELKELPGLPAEEFPDAFAAMTDLRHLELEWTYRIDSLLAGLSRVPHLATVRIKFDTPSVAALQSLLAQTETTSRVHVTLQLAQFTNSAAFSALDPQRFTLLPTEKNEGVWSSTR